MPHDRPRSHHDADDQPEQDDSAAARRPIAIGAAGRRRATTAGIALGALSAVASGAGHLRLYADPAYRPFPTIGALFLARGVTAIPLGFAAVTVRRLWTVLATAGFLLATVAGMQLSIEVGLFGFREPGARRSSSAR